MKPADLRARFRRVRLVIFDVDGVLTDGSIMLLADGSEMKRFNAADGAGIKYLERAGIATALLTGRRSRVVTRRAKELGIRFVVQGSLIKMDGLARILRKTGLSADDMAYMGDDLPDVPVLRVATLAAAPADARPEVRALAHWVSRYNGGHGAAREFCEAILKAQSKWGGIISRYGLTAEEDAP